MRKLLVCAALLTVVAFVAGPATADSKARWSKGRAGGSLAFGTDHVVAGSEYQVAGTGFRPDTWVSVGARYGTTYWASGVTDSSGSFTFTFTARGSGQVLHDAYEQGNSGRWRLNSSATLTVYPA